MADYLGNRASHWLRLPGVGTEAVGAGIAGNEQQARP